MLLAKIPRELPTSFHLGIRISCRLQIQTLHLDPHPPFPAIHAYNHPNYYFQYSYFHDVGELGESPKPLVLLPLLSVGQNHAVQCNPLSRFRAWLIGWPPWNQTARRIVGVKNWN